jgi:hypothetical protein
LTKIISYYSYRGVDRYLDPKNQDFPVLYNIEILAKTGIEAEGILYELGYNPVDILKFFEKL